MIFFLSIFWMNQSLLSPKKVVPNFFFFLRKLLTFSTFFLRPKPSTRLNMAYMKFQKKMLGGSDFFLDLDSQIFRNFVDFSPSTPKKAQNFFAAAQPPSRYRLCLPVSWRGPPARCAIFGPPFFSLNFKS